MVTFSQALADKTAAVEAAIARALTTNPDDLAEALWLQWARLKVGAGSGGITQAETTTAFAAALTAAGLQNVDGNTGNVEQLLSEILLQLQAEQAIASEVWTDATETLYYKVASFNEATGQFDITSALPDGTPYTPTAPEQLANSGSAAPESVSQVYEVPVGNGVLSTAPAEGGTPAAIAYEAGATTAIIQIRSGSILFSDGQTPATAPLIFELGEGDYYILDSAEQIQNFRYASLGSPDAEVSAQQFGPSVESLTVEEESPLKLVATAITTKPSGTAINIDLNHFSGAPTRINWGDGTITEPSPTRHTHTFTDGAASHVLEFYADPADWLNFYNDRGEITEFVVSEDYNYPQLALFQVRINALTSFVEPAKFTAITNFKLENNQLTSDFVGRPEWTRIKTLGMGANAALQNANIPPEWTELETIDFANCNLSAFTIPAGLSKLQTLFIRNNNIADFSPLFAVLATDSYTASSRTVSITGNPGAALLSIAEIQAAEGNGWTVNT